MIQRQLGLSPAKQGHRPNPLIKLKKLFFSVFSAPKPGLSEAEGW